MDIKKFVTETITHLTGETPDVTIDEDEHGAVITITVYGRVSSLVGKNGITIHAFRTMLKAIGYNGKHRIKLRVHEQAR